VPANQQNSPRDAFFWNDDPFPLSFFNRQASTFLDAEKTVFRTFGTGGCRRLDLQKIFLVKGPMGLFACGQFPGWHLEFFKKSSVIG